MVAMSHFSAQLVEATYFSADRTLPVSRLATKKKPLRSAFINAGTVFAVDLQVGENQFVDAVIVPRIGRRSLDMPFDLAGVRIERQRGGGVEVGQLAEFAVAGGTDAGVPWAGVAGAPINRIGLGIVGADQPGRAAAVQAGIAFPGIAAGFARAGTVKVCQSCLPVLMSKACSEPRTPYSPPPKPVMTLSRTTNGGEVITDPCL